MLDVLTLTLYMYIIYCNISFGSCFMLLACPCIASICLCSVIM